ncbi:MAG: hypothetical protein HY606_06165, partial [Planctomycetes bacterium]|nr:hypothetical protein [Planctomycetota bacterium]
MSAKFRALITKYRLIYFLGLIFRSSSIIAVTFLMIFEIGAVFGSNVSLNILFYSLIADAVICVYFAIKLPKRKIIYELDIHNNFQGSLITLYELGSSDDNFFIKSIFGIIAPKLVNIQILNHNYLTQILVIAFSITLLWMLNISGYSTNSYGNTNIKKNQPNLDNYAETDNKVDSKLNFDFIAFPTTGKAPLSVVFQSRINSTYDQLEWNFGDFVSSSSGTSSEGTPVYTYKFPGVYTVSLTVDVNGKKSKKTKDEYIIVEEESSEKNSNKNSNIDPMQIPNLDEPTTPNDSDDKIDPFKTKPVSVKIESTLSDRIKREIELLLDKKSDKNRDIEDVKQFLNVN